MLHPQAKAAVQADALWRLASMRVAALAEAGARPRVALELAAHAPKLAVPDAGERVVLLLDLGHLGLVADRWGPALKSPATLKSTSGGASYA